MRNKIKILFITIFILISANSASGHSDTILHIAEDGTIKRLPEKYQPATYSRESHTLRIGKNIVRFPTCLVDKFFHFDSSHDVSLTGSWYHNSSILPPYIAVGISVPDRTYSFDILLELDTLRLIKISFNDQVERKTYTRSLSYELELDESCVKEYHRSVNQG